jgi:hypothetical protein
LVKQRCWEEDQITKGKRDKKNQLQLLGFFQRNGKKKKLPRETASSATEDGSGAVTDDNNLNQVNTDCVVSSKSLVSNNDLSLVDVACARSSNSLVSNNDPKQHQVACAGAFNSVSGKTKNDVSLVHQYVVIYPKNAKLKWGMYNSIPAIMSMGCTVIEILKAIDGGLACQNALIFALVGAPLVQVYF